MSAGGTAEPTGVPAVSGGMSGSNRAAAGIGLSRIFGLVREILISASLGTSVAAEGFRVAMRIPNIVQNLLGEGSLSASFVPVYAKLVEDRDEAEARRVAGGVLGLLTLAIIAIVGLMVLATGPVISVTTLGRLTPEVHDQAVTLTRITAPGIGLLGISAWCLGILNSHRQYFLGYVAPVLWNVAQIAALVAVGLIGVFLDDGLSTATVATILAIAVTVGSVAQLGVQLPRVRALTNGVTPHLRRDGQTRVVLRRFGPAVGARGVVQLSSFIDLTLAASLSQGALAVLGIVMPLYLLPVSLFGFSVATTELTEMARQSDRSDVVVRRVELGLRKVILPAGLVAAVFIGASRPIIETLYQWPSDVLGFAPINDDETTLIGVVLLVFALALPATMSARITQNALYALGEVRKPAQIAVVRLVVLTVVTIACMFQFDRLIIDGGDVTGWSELPVGLWAPLPDDVRSIEGIARMGVVGIALGAAIAAWVEWVLLRRALQVRLGRHLSSGLVLPVTAATVGTAAALWALQVLLPLGAPFNGILIGLAGIGIYIGLLRFQGLRPRA